jgi:hypothetical protein
MYTYIHAFIYTYIVHTYMPTYLYTEVHRTYMNELSGF